MVHRLIIPIHQFLATALKCYLGTPKDPKLTDCGTTGDLCTNTTVNGVMTWACTNKAALDKVDTDLAKGGCKDVKVLTVTTKHCVCNTEGCNSASAQSIIQMFTMITSSYFMKIAFA